LLPAFFLRSIPRFGLAESEAEPMIGQTVSHYRILEKLGEGGMGVVYAAEDTHLGRRVAIKFPASTSGERDFRARFLREARAVSTLSHHHIAAIYDYGEVDNGGNGKNQPFIVMELIKGSSLAELMNEGALTLKRAVGIIVDVAEALAEAHHHGVIHRDIKPSNVLLNERGEVKVLDFGLAKQLNEDAARQASSDARTLFATQTRSGAVVGTPLYLSPEQARGGQVDRRSDLFALGALLYECITGKPAFAGTGVLEIAGQVLHVEPPPPSSVNPRVPKELDRITMKALAKKPEARYQSAEEMLADLRAAHAALSDEDKQLTERLAASEAGHSSALSTISHALKRPRLSLGLFLIVIVIAGLAVWGLMRLLRPAPYKASAEAQRWYDTGTAAIRDGLFYQASTALEKAISADENFALAHARYAEALMELDYVDRAKDELLRASALAPDRATLLPLDALYLDAITASVRRDFPGAIEAYSAIARQSPNDPQVYVDLGRAYENNEEPAKAIESYLKATALDQQYATAHLRAGVLYGRQQQQLPSAFASLEKADQLYQALGKVEGRAEVLHQRGDLLIKSGKIAEAREQLQQALELAQVTNNQSQQIKTMLHLVYVFQHQGETAKAQKLADDALNLAQANNMEHLTARGYTDLGIVFLLRNDYGAAEKYFRQGLEFAQRFKARRTEARALFLLGSLRVQQSNTDEAVPYIEQALSFYQQGGYQTEVSLTFILLGRVHRMKGDYEAALKLYRQQLQFAEQVNNQRQKSLAVEGIGTILAYQERYPEARGYFEQKYEISKALNNQTSVGYSLMEMSDVLREMGRLDDARARLAEAFSLVDRPDGGFQVLLIVAHRADAELALNERLFPAAKEKSQKALALAGGQFRESTIEAKRILGLALGHSGAAREGRRWCEEALEMAGRAKNPWLISRAQLALAEVMLESGDAPGALKTALEAQASFERSGQQASEWRAWALAARSSQRLNDETKGREYAARAAQTLAKLEQKWGAEVYSSYLIRPDVQYLRKQLNEEFALSKVN
jgi:serine/threonine protein kinase/Tfp pilus assembly protein PilF